MCGPKQDALAQGAGGRVRDAAEAERVAEAVVALAGRLDALLREFSGTPEAASRLVWWAGCPRVGGLLVGQCVMFVVMGWKQP